MIRKMTPQWVLLAAFSLSMLACGGGGKGDGSSNLPPVATFTAVQVSATAPLEIRFDASASSDSDGNIVSYAWVFGDGLAGSSAVPVITHSYGTAGTYSVTLTVTDNLGGIGKTTNDLTVSPAASVTFTIEGTITSASNITVDSDVNDPNAAFSSNNSVSEAQLLPNPVVVNGFVSAVKTGNPDDRFGAVADPVDIYQAELVAGQYVSLRVADFDAEVPNRIDLDIALYDADLNLVAVSDSADEFESLAVPADGRYYIEVYPYFWDLGNPIEGISKYVLNIGSVSLKQGPTVNGWPADFVPEQAIFKQNSRHISSASAQALDQLDGIMHSHRDAGRAALLTLAPDADPASAFAMPAQHSGAARGMRDEGEIRLPAETRRKLQTLAFIKQLNGRADVEYAEPNFILRPLQVPNDPYYDYQEHYPQIHLPQAWDVTTGKPASGEVIVAVVDTGVFLDHEDLSGQLVGGYDFISAAARANDGDGIDPNPDDPGDDTQAGLSSWHGTHVAGTVAATTNNAIGGAGVAWNAKVMPIRVLGVGGGTTYDILQGVRYAAGLTNDSGSFPLEKAAIINLSLGGPAYSQADQDTYTQVRNAGVIVIAAAGNKNSSEPSYPAAYDGVVSVSAVDWQNNRASYSNYGATVDVAAPGGDTSVDRNGDGNPDGILSSVADDTGAQRVSNYQFYQGTSMAAPHVAGVAALMKAIIPGLTPEQFDSLLADGQLTHDLGEPGLDELYGHGIIDALKAVQAAQKLVSGGASANPVVVNPTIVDFGTELNSAQVTLTYVGETPPGVIAVSDNAPWLSVQPDAVDANGLGVYTLAVDRSGLVDASYSGTVIFSLEDGSEPEVQVSMRVQTQMAHPGNAGYLYVVLLDSEYNHQDQLQLDAVNGKYGYAFAGLSSGEYFVIAGTDVDNNGYICEIGESCGAYPLWYRAQPINVNQNLSGLDFTATINSGLSGTAGAASAQPVTQGYPLDDDLDKEDAVNVKRVRR